ncbi:amidohydrolase [Ornithinibacillus californiensis]|uniref:amidohydrolase n=1 Tax=Ornithinibacillus californiensis TaxID=161536 RepID=UPI00069DF2C6|nr:amidohydrolase [Ornithinibacillus californiensis]
MSRPIDYILTSTAVFTGTSNQPKPAAILVSGNQITTIIAIEDIDTYTSEHTTVLDFGDKLIMPGFHDFHIHLLLGSMLENSVQLYDARSAKESAALVKAYADTHPEQSLIIGSGWDDNTWTNRETVDKKYLDEVVPDKPVILYQAEFHSAWVNSAMLKLAGITAETPNPEFGEVVKDENGEPTGLLLEHAVGLVTKAMPMDLKHKEQLLEQFLQEAKRYGVTSVHDLLRLPEMSTEEAEIYADFEDRDKLTTRVHFVAPLNGDLEEAIRLRETYNSNMVQFTGFKQFIDGVITSYTAYLLEPYTNKVDSIGGTVYHEELIKKWTIVADKNNFRVRFHCVGDKAVNLALDTFEEAQKQNGKRDSRHAIEHIEMIQEADIPRFQELGVLASIQPEHINGSSYDVFEDLIGEERMKLYMLQKTLKDNGATLVYGSDFPVVGLNPLTAIYRAVTRVDDDQVVWNKDEKIMLADALKAYTFAPAYGAFREEELGTLEEDKLADLIVLDCNLFNVSPEEIKTASVIFTMVDGKVVYENN